MMLIATTAAALFATIAFAAAGPAPSAAIPPITIDVTAAGELSAQLASRVLAETQAIWRAAGVGIVWRRAPRAAVPYEQAGDTGPYASNALRLIIGNNPGTASSTRRPLGWIVFDDVTGPQREIYLSYANALALMVEARGVVGLMDQMPLAQRETLLGRAMGRALAHELGHYLLASKAHTDRGLMKAVLTAVEMFAPDASGFRIDSAQRRAVAARLLGEPIVASR